MTQFYIRPETISEDRFGNEIGPFKHFIQLTYNDLRSGPDGDPIAYMDKEGKWRFYCQNPEIAWSDIVIYTK